MDSCFQRICEIRDVLPVTEQRIADAILKSPKKVCLFTVTELAEYCNSSPATITRMCKSLGYSGYKDFIKKLILDMSTFTDENNEEVVSEGFQEVVQGDSVKTVVSKVVNNNVLAIKNTFQVLDLDSLNNAIEMITKTPRLYFFGLGGSSIAVKDAEFRFVRLGKDVHAYTSFHEQVFAVGGLKKDDVVVFISYSGETKEILSVAEMVKKMGATVISITRFSNNSLSKIADVSLKSASISNSYRSFSSSAQISQLNMIDIIYSSCASMLHESLQNWYELTQSIMNKEK